MKKAIAATVSWFGEYVRGLYPFGVSFVGGLVLMAHDDIGGLAAMVIAALCFAWANDLAATRAAARAKEDTATLLTSMLVSGNDTTVTVDINHNSSAS